MTKEEYIKRWLGGASLSWQEAQWQRVLDGDHYEECPLAKAGFTLATFSELPSMVIGPDGKCICTKDVPCINCDNHTGNRCTLKQLKQLDYEAGCRRARQSGEGW